MTFTALHMVFAFVAGCFAWILVRWVIVKLPYPWWDIRFAETVPEQGLAHCEWVPNHLEPITILHLTTGVWRWRRSRDVIRKVSMYQVKNEKIRHHRTQRRWRADYEEYYWADTGVPLGFFAASRVGHLKALNSDAEKRRAEAGELEAAAITNLLTEPESEETPARPAVRVADTDDEILAAMDDVATAGASNE